MTPDYIQHKMRPFSPPWNALYRHTEKRAHNKQHQGHNFMYRPHYAGAKWSLKGLGYWENKPPVL